MGNSSCKKSSKMCNIKDVRDDIINNNISNTRKFSHSIVCERDLKNSSYSLTPTAMGLLTTPSPYPTSRTKIVRDARKKGIIHNGKVFIYLKSKEGMMEDLEITNDCYEKVELVIGSIISAGDLNKRTNTWIFKQKIIPLFLLTSSTDVYVQITPVSNNRLKDLEVKIKYKQYSLPEETRKNAAGKAFRSGNLMFSQGMVY